MQLHHNKPNESYGEESQDRPCRFYFAKYVAKNKRLETNHGPVLCRDFLSDTLVWKAKEKDPCSIYGWKYTGVVETKYTSLVIDNYGEFLHNLKTILNPIEEKIGIKLTEAKEVMDQDEQKHVWVKGDKFWMTTTVHFSWYTTLLRYLTYSHKFQKFDELEKYPTNDWMNNKDTFEKFKKLPYVLPQLKVFTVRGCGDDVYGSSIHDYNGWYNNCSNHAYKSKYTKYAGQLNELLAQGTVPQM